MRGPRRLPLEPMGPTFWENCEKSLPPLCNGRCNGHLTAIGAPGLFLALQRSKNRSDLTGQNAGGKPTPIAVDLTRRAPLGSPWFGLCSRLPPRHGFGGVPLARCLWGPWDASQTNRPSTNTHMWRGWLLGMPVRTTFLGWPHLRRPGKAANMGHAHAAPYPGSWAIPKKGAERPLRVSGLASRVGSLPGHLQAEPCGSRKSVNPARFFLFFASLWHPPPCHCLDPRARPAAGTHAGWHEPAPTSALVFRLQDHCDSAQVWVGARKQSALAAPKLNKGCLTQSTAPPKPPEGLTSGTCHRIAGLAGGRGPADMAVCHTHADSGRKSPTNTGGWGAWPLVPLGIGCPSQFYVSLQ